MKVTCTKKKKTKNQFKAVQKARLLHIEKVQKGKKTLRLLVKTKSEPSD